MRHPAHAPSETTRRQEPKMNAAAPIRTTRLTAQSSLRGVELGEWRPAAPKRRTQSRVEARSRRAGMKKTMTKPERPAREKMSDVSRTAAHRSNEGSAHKMPGGCDVSGRGQLGPIRAT